MWQVDVLNENNYHLHTMNQETQKSAPQPATADSARIRSEDLLRGRSELLIVHKGREYRLRVTQNDKLILTA